MYDIAAEGFFIDFGEVFRRVAFQFFEENAVARYFSQDLSVGRAGYGNADRAGCAVAGQANNAHIVAEVFAAKLRANADFVTHFEDLFFHFEIAESLAVFIALRGQGVEIFGTCEFGGFEGVFCGCAANDEGEVIGRAGGCAEFAQAQVDEVAQAFGIEQCSGFLIEQAFVGGPTAFGHEHEFVRIPLLGIDLDLSGQVGFGICFLKHVEWCQLAVAQVCFQKGSGNALCERGFVAAVGPYAIALFAHDNGCARVLTHGEDTACGDVGIFEHFNGDKAVVVRGFGVVENFG